MHHCLVQSVVVKKKKKKSQRKINHLLSKSSEHQSGWHHFQSTQLDQLTAPHSASREEHDEAEDSEGDDRKKSQPKGLLVLLSFGFCLVELRGGAGVGNLSQMLLF